MTKIQIEIDTELQRVVPVSRLTVRELPPLYADEGRQEQVNISHYYSGWNDLVSILAAAPQPEPVDADLRRDAELWRAHQKRKQDLIDRGFLKSCLRSEESDMSQGELK